LDALTVDFDLLRHKFSYSFVAVCCGVIYTQPGCVTRLAAPKNPLHELSRRQQRAIEDSDEESFRSKLLAMNPKRFKFHQILQGMSVGSFRTVLCSKWASSRASQWPARAIGANENIPNPHHRPKTAQE
jgi:hypothetical protein